MTLRNYAFSRKRRAEFSEDVYAFVLWRYVAIQIWRYLSLLLSREPLKDVWLGLAKGYPQIHIYYSLTILHLRISYDVLCENLLKLLLQSGVESFYNVRHRYHALVAMDDNIL